MNKLFIGLDIGSTYVKAVAWDNAIIKVCSASTAWDFANTAEKVVSTIVGTEQCKKYDEFIIATTGYGRNLYSKSNVKHNEIICHLVGCRCFFPQVRTIIDIGGQDSKVITVTDEGEITDFVLNDKCAAGTGRFLQYLAQSMHTTIEELMQLSQDKQPVNISSMCTVFAESEIISLLSSGVDRGEVSAGILETIINRVLVMTRKIDAQPQYVLSGGFSSNKIFVDYLSNKLKHEIVAFEMGQYSAAIGAAIITANEYAI